MFAWCLGAVAQGRAQTAVRTPSTSPVVLVELFTSEGCSSCPPADRLLQMLDGTHTAEGQLVVGISEHVTYWNSLGWTDPFSSDAYTQRQSGYARRLRLDEVYTPQMVVAGREQFVGSDAVALQRAFAEEAKRATAHEVRVDLQIVSAKRVGDALQVRFTAGGLPPDAAGDVIAVVADDVDSSHVLRGENAAQTLTHVAVARSLERVAALHGSAEKTVSVRLPPSVLSNYGARHHVVLFAQAEQYGPVLGAAAAAF